MFHTCRGCTIVDHPVQPNVSHLQVAIKVIDTSKVSREFNRKFLPRELELWKNLKHPHLVEMLSQFNVSLVID